MNFFNSYTKELIASVILIVLVILLRLIVSKLVRSFAKKSQTIENRTQLVLKYIHLILNCLALTTLVIIWGVKTDDIFLVLSSIATIAGVAMFAQWSILSNITAGIILFFSSPYKIGDVIFIHDKDFPIQAEIDDIGAFYVYLKTRTGEEIVYPNSLMLQKGISILKNPTESSSFND